MPIKLTHPLYLLIFLLLHSCKLTFQDKVPDEQIPNDFASTEKVEIVDEAFSKRQGCNIFYPQNMPEILLILRCKDDDQFVLDEMGNFYVDNLLDPAPYKYICEDEELVVNPSFEEGHDLGENEWGVYTNLPGWFANVEEVNAPIEIQNGDNIGGLRASHGKAKLELDSHAKNGFKASDAIVYQVIPTLHNQMYRLRFDYSPRVKNDVSTNIVEVYWNGSKIAHLNNIKVGWQRFELNVLGNDIEGQLEFRALLDKDTLGGYIDNISLKAVCED